MSNQMSDPLKNMIIQAEEFTDLIMKNIDSLSNMDDFETDFLSHYTNTLNHFDRFWFSNTQSLNKSQLKRQTKRFSRNTGIFFSFFLY